MLPPFVCSRASLWTEVRVTQINKKTSVKTLEALCMSGELETTLVRLHRSCEYNTSLCDYMGRTVRGRNDTLRQLEAVLKEWGRMDGQVI